MDRCVGDHLFGSSGNSRLGMVDEGRASARFVLRRMRGYGGLHLHPHCQRVETETSKAAPAKT